MPDPFLTLVSTTVGICLLAAITCLLMAARGIGRDAALAFAAGFGAIAVTWSIEVYLPQSSGEPNASLLLVNFLGATGTVGIASGLWLHAGHRVNWPFMGAVLGLWVIPVIALLLFNLGPDFHVPFASTAIGIGFVSCAWKIFRKTTRKNPADWALIGCLLIMLPITAGAWFSATNSGSADLNLVWMYYLGFLPSLFTGLALFTMLGFVMDAIYSSTRLAMTDSLTELPNRRAFDSELSVAVARATRYQRDLSLILLDIDHFKQLNDTYGHPVGDMVIRAVARVLMEETRQIDVPARIGGEEFGIILGDTPPSAALRLAERLRLAVSHSTSELSVTASFGVAGLTDTDTQADKLLKAADEALYAAKGSGRDCVRYAGDPSREPGSLIELVN